MYVRSARIHSFGPEEEAQVREENKWCEEGEKKVKKRKERKRRGTNSISISQYAACVNVAVHV